MFGPVVGSYLDTHGDAPSPPRFPDVDPANVHADNIERLAKREITGGDAHGNYDPSRAVTRAQVASFLARALGMAAIPREQFDDIGVEFVDVASDSTHAGTIYAMAQAGIIQGVTDETFEPDWELTRAGPPILVQTT